MSRDRGGPATLIGAPLVGRDPEDVMTSPILPASPWPPAMAFVAVLAPFVVGGVWLGAWWLDQPSTVLPPPVTTTAPASAASAVPPVSFTNPPTTTARAARVPVPVTARAPAPTTTARAAAAPFANCGEALAAGRSNIPASDPRYHRRLDRDGDGVGCDDPSPNSPSMSPPPDPPPSPDPPPPPDPVPDPPPPDPAPDPGADPLPEVIPGGTP